MSLKIALKAAIDLSHEQQRKEVTNCLFAEELFQKYGKKTKTTVYVLWIKVAEIKQTVQTGREQCYSYL